VRGIRGLSAFWACALAAAAPVAVGDGPVGYVVWYAAAGLVLVALARAVRRSAGPARAVWVLLLATATCWIAGDVAWDLLEVRSGERPAASVADVLYLAGYPALLAAVVVIARRRDPASARDVLLDGVVVTASAGLVVWQAFVVGPDVLARGSLAERVVAAAYPIADLVVLAALVGVLLVAGGGSTLRRIAVFLVVLLATDIAAAVVGAVHEDGLRFVDPWFLVGYGLLGTAAAADDAPRIADAAPRRGPARVSRFAVVGLSVVVPPVVAVTAPMIGQDVAEPLVLAVAVVVAGLVAARVVALLATATRAQRTSERAEAALAHRANHDGLTGLPNRDHLLEQLEAVLGPDAPPRRAGAPALLFCDLDRFKFVNDSLGHRCGDLLLQEAARRIAGAVRTGDVVTRLGGDEFVVLCPAVSGHADAVAVADRITAAMAEPFDLDGSEAFTTVSVGVALAEPGATSESLLADADMALYEAKESGRNRHGVFDSALRGRAARRLSTETALRKALDRDELFLVYQPQVDLADGGVVGFEALVRWDRPGEGVVPPAEFIDVAESTGLIGPIGDWVLERACAQLTAWNAARPPSAALEVSVNVSPIQLGRPGIARQVERVVTGAGLDPRRLVVELTETSLVEHGGVARRRLDALRDLGVRLAVDDFGTGYSSLAYLRRLPLDRIKIDKVFVDDLGGAVEGHTIAAAIVAIARTLRLEACAENVETPAQARELRAMGCEKAQGYLWAAPLGTADATSWAGGASRPAPPVGSTQVSSTRRG
jgi:diguanylate cyclase